MQAKSVFPVFGIAMPSVRLLPRGLRRGKGKPCRPLVLTVGMVLAIGCVSANDQASREAQARLRGTRPHAPRKALDVNSLKDPQLSLSQARSRAGGILKKMIVSGDSYEAVHALTYARVTGDKDMLASIRARFMKPEPKGSGESWGEAHVKLGALHALIVMTNEKFPQQIARYLKSEDPGVKVRALMLARDSKDPVLTAVVRAAVENEEDSPVKAAGLSALAAIEGRNSPAAIQLAALAKANGDSGARARIELAQSGADPPEAGQVLSRQEEEKYKQLAVSDRHDDRMFGIEEIARKGSEGSRGWLRRLGASEDWRMRLTSAYYLLQAGEAREAQNRLASETHPLVQVTLLGALRAPEANP